MGRCSRGLRRGAVAAAVILFVWDAGCTGRAPDPLGRPCSTEVSCGPDARCDLTRGVCVATGSPPPSTCSPQSCPGCCDRGECKPGTGGGACGRGGELCTDCALVGKQCTAGGQCSTSGCEPKCAGKCAGADDGCNGTCPTGSCPGCCNGTSCELGTDDRACGATGGGCLDCGAAGGKCDKGSCTGLAKCDPSICGKGCCEGTTCKAGNEPGACGTGGGACENCATASKSCKDQKCEAGCTIASCANKCQGADDGCGKPCPSNTCTGCCDGTTCHAGAANDRCGTGGGGCQNCTTSSKSCSGGSCQSTCPSTCTGKCPGADDGCGKPCATNGCGGCCDGTACRVGNTNGACGLNGVTCKGCGSYPEFICNTSGACQQNCTRSCAGKCQGADDGCGTPCATNACTGCCDSSKRCQAGNTVGACGKGGATCQSCGSNSCLSGRCCNTTTCAGCAEGEMCVGGLKRCCISGVCKYDAQYCF